MDVSHVFEGLGYLKWSSFVHIPKHFYRGISRIASMKTIGAAHSGIVMILNGFKNKWKVVKNEHSGVCFRNNQGRNLEF